MFKIAFFAMLLSSCIKHVPTEQGIHGFAGENFVSTNSPCMDGVMVAVDRSCAVPMTMEQTGPYVMIQCSEVRKNMAPWNEYNVIVIIDPREPDPASGNMTCADPYSRVYIQKRP